MDDRPPPKLSLALAVLIGSQIALLAFDFEKIGLTADGVDIGRWALIAPGQVLLGPLLIALSPELLRTLRRGPVALVALWLGWNLASALWSVDPRQTVLQSIGAINLFLIAVWVVSRHGSLTFLRLTSRAIAAVIAAGVAYQALGGVDDSAGRFEGLSEGFNQLGIQAAVGVVFALAARRRATTRTHVDTGVAAFLAVALIASGARGPVLAAAVGAAFLGVRILRDPRLRIPALGFSVLAAVAIGFTLVGGVGIFSRGEESALNGRDLVWDHAADLVVEAPLLGHGMMTGLSLWTEAVVAGAVGFTAGSAHNLVLEVLVGGGVVGLALFAAALAMTFRGSIAARDWERLSVAAILLIAGFAESLVARPSLIHWTLGGIAAIVATTASQPRPDQSASRGPGSDGGHMRRPRSRLVGGGVR